MSLLDKFSTKKVVSIEDSILTHICELLNTKKEFGCINKDLGLGSFSHHSLNATLANCIAGDIRFNIEKYEKRIRVLGVDVLPSTDFFQLNFRLRCTIGVDNRSFNLAFNHNNKQFTTGGGL